MLEHFEHKTILQYIGLMLIIMSGIRILHQILIFDYYIQGNSKIESKLHSKMKYFFRTLQYKITYLMFAIGIALLHFFK
jgi:uncharacterized membrane protein